MVTVDKTVSSGAAIPVRRYVVGFCLCSQGCQGLQCEIDEGRNSDMDLICNMEENGPEFNSISKPETC